MHNKARNIGFESYPSVASAVSISLKTQIHCNHGEGGLLVEQRGAPATSTTSGTDYAAVAAETVGRREQV